MTESLSTLETQCSRALDTGGGHLEDANQGPLASPDEQRSHFPNEIQARAAPLDDASGQTLCEDRSGSAAGVVANTIIETYRQRVDLHRAELRLVLQIQAICRRISGGSKTEASKLYAALNGGDDTHENFEIGFGACVHLMNARDHLAVPRKGLEADLEKMAKDLPVWDSWCSNVKGVGGLTLAKIVGEANLPIGEYRTVSGLWKRMGLAVMPDGCRQRRVSGEAAIEHGYAPARRAMMYVCGEGLMKAQIRAVKDDDGKPTRDRNAIGPYGEIYIARRAIESERLESAAHAHNRAKRFMEKRFLRDLWVAWRAADRSA